MASVEHAISEHAVVELRGETNGWRAGTVGTVVRDYGREKLVEVSDTRGRATALVRVPVDRLRSR